MPGVSKVEYYGETLIDLTNDTVTAENLDEGVTAHDATGEQITGKRAVVNPSDYVKKSGDTMEGVLKAQNNTQYTVPQVRNVIHLPEGSDMPTLGLGDECWFYEVVD